MKIKLLIWDLDETLWKGTLAEGDAVALMEHRVGFVRALNMHGIVSAICSKNDPEKTKQTLIAFGLWDEFVFPRIAFVPKGAAVKQLIEDMQLRPVNVLFIDDNALNLNEAKALLPELNIVDSTTQECDKLLARILDENKGVHKSRIEEYRILQAKTDDRQNSSVSNEEFLRSCDIHAAFAFRTDCVDFVDRIEELVNRSNQLNYTQSRIEPGSIAEKVMDVMNYPCWALFAWDKYGYYGLIGFMMVERTTRITSRMLHFVFSCRVMHMGLEQVLYSIAETYPGFDRSTMILPLPDVIPDWIKVMGFEDPVIRELILTKEAPTLKPASTLRIMYNCQSGGIAHYSKYRDYIDFDNSPRFFSLSLIFKGGYQEQHYPPALIYGASLDYPDASWPSHSIPFLAGNFSMCVLAFCTHCSERGSKVLVILPPETLPDDKYHKRKHYDFSRERAVAFNSTWRIFAARFPNMTILELSDFATANDMYDADHLYASLLQKIAYHVDDWYERIAFSGSEADRQAIETDC